MKLFPQTDLDALRGWLDKRAQSLKRERRFEASCLRRMNTGGVHVREFNADDCGSYSPQYGSIMPSLRLHR